MRRCCHSMRYEEHSDEKRLAYNANWTCRSHAFKKNIMKDDLIVEAVADGDNDAIRAILADVCSLTNMRFAAVARVTEDRWIACRSEEHTYELQSLMRISYAVFCLK